ncbi:MAG: hypothetical protein K6E94_03485 [Elusimicrobiaceae bacterium]|nr:hypothetical protein [Elusimicrobiaceae bacterium]
MKKLNLFLLGILVLAGCSATPKTTESEGKLSVPTVSQQDLYSTSKKASKTDCKINGYKCWNVLKLFTLNSQLTEEQREAKLKKLGLTITYSTMYRDGGSWSYQLSDGTAIHVTNSIWDRSGDIKVKLPDGTTVMYDAQGNQK